MRRLIIEPRLCVVFVTIHFWPFVVSPSGAGQVRMLPNNSLQDDPPRAARDWYQTLVYIIIDSFEREMILDSSIQGIHIQRIYSFYLSRKLDLRLNRVCFKKQVQISSFRLFQKSRRLASRKYQPKVLSHQVHIIVYGLIFIYLYSIFELLSLFRSLVQARYLLDKGKFNLQSSLLFFS